MNGKFMEDETLFSFKKWSLVIEPGHEKWLERKLKLISSNPIEYKSRHKTMIEKNEPRFIVLLL